MPQMAVFLGPKPVPWDTSPTQSGRAYCFPGGPGMPFVVLTGTFAKSFILPCEHATNMGITCEHAAGRLAATPAKSCRTSSRVAAAPRGELPHLVHSREELPPQDLLIGLSVFCTGRLWSLGLLLGMCVFCAGRLSSLGFLPGLLVFCAG